MSTERAQKNQQLILQRLAAVGQERVAEELGVDDSTIYNLKASDRVKINLEAISKMLAVLDIKCVPATYKCVDPRTFAVLYEGHRLWTESVHNPDELMFDEDPE